MKNSGINVKNKLISRYLVRDHEVVDTKSTNINILLNRVKLNEKLESRKKIFFSAIASSSLILFGFLIFS